MGDHATREEMLIAFGPFSAAFEPIGDDTTPYLSLLHLQYEGTEKVIHLIRDAAHTDHPESFILTLLQDVNWRPHLVGALATYFRPSELAISQIWRAVDAGSWVSPQLAAVLSLIDRSFIGRSLERLRLKCPLSDDPEYYLDSPIERHVARGPSGSYHRSCKATSSILALLRQDVPHDDRVRPLDNDRELQQLVSDDVDNSGWMALSWRGRLLELVV